MKNMRKKVALVLALVLVLAFTLGSVGTAFGAPIAKVIRVFSNGQAVAMDKSPVMINDSVFVPIRAMATILGKNVDWDSAAYAVRVTESATSTANAAKIKELENTIAQLKTTIAEKDNKLIILQAQYDALLKEQSGLSFKDMEKQLNKNYGNYRDLEFEIALSGKEKDITVEIGVSMRNYQDEWDSLSSSRKTSFLQNIVDDLLKEYKNADIEGYIYDSYRSSKPKLLTFTLTSSNKVSISSKGDLSDLEEELDYNYSNYFRDIRMSLDLEGDEDDIEFYVNVNYSRYGAEWDNLSDTEVEKLMRYIYYDIEDDFEDAVITGYVINSANNKSLAEYSVSSRGAVRFYRY